MTRRKIDVGVWGLGINLIVYIITVVWFASALNAAVEQNKELTSQLNESTRELTVAVQQLQISQAGVQVQVRMLERLIQDERR